MSREKHALSILKDTDYMRPVSAREFGVLFWPRDEYPILHNARTNTGNGACSGKKLWLSAGSYLSKLVKKGLVYKRIDPNGYYISQKGKETLK